MLPSEYLHYFSGVNLQVFSCIFMLDLEPERRIALYKSAKPKGAEDRP